MHTNTTHPNREAENTRTLAKPKAAPRKQADSQPIFKPNTLPELVGDSPAMQRLRQLITALASRDCTVMIEGESGTGKELVARHLHHYSTRASNPFVPVDCTTLRDSLFESQLFGHAKGAFTGAERSTIGFFRAADSGTLFLDEVGELDGHIQAKLLRSIQDRAVVPLGDVNPVPVNVRIITATHCDLGEMVRDSKFREDLYFRLNVVRLEVPPLRARRTDIMVLAQYFLDQQAKLYNEPMRRIAEDARHILENYSWPGNIRELANAVEHAYVMSQGEWITADHLPEGIRADDGNNATEQDIRNLFDQVVPLETAEKALIARALEVCGGNQSQAAALLEIERRRLYRKVKGYGLDDLTRYQRSADA